jgi:tetratricopeptide (TPR) repeat protein
MEAGKLAQELRAARRRSGVTFAAFARRAGFSESHLRSVENGHRALTDQVAAAYDQVLGTGGVFLAAIQDDGPEHAQVRYPSPVPWDPVGTLSAMTGLVNGDPMDRRQFITVSGAALTALAAHWSTAVTTGPHPVLPPASGSRQVEPAMTAHIGVRLNHLRHLDDELGSGDLAQLARSELALVVRLLRHGTYTDQAGRELYTLAAEASRQAAWDYFDQAHHPVARRYFETALRASAAAGDPISGAYALSFLAVQCYSTGQAQHAVALLDTAQSAVGRAATPRMTAMLCARAARAHSKTGSRRDCARMLHQARAMLDKGPHPSDPDVLYWVTHGEIEMIAGSSALELGDPAHAIRCFDAAIKADYRGDDQFPRTHVIYLARAAEAHLALHDLDAAVDRAERARRCLSTVSSARSDAALSGLRAKLARHASSPTVKAFLAARS